MIYNKWIDIDSIIALNTLDMPNERLNSMNGIRIRWTIDSDSDKALEIKSRKFQQQQNFIYQINRIFFINYYGVLHCSTRSVTIDMRNNLIKRYHTNKSSIWFRWNRVHFGVFHFFWLKRRFTICIDMLLSVKCHKTNHICIVNYKIINSMWCCCFDWNYNEISISW